MALKYLARSQSSAAVGAVELRRKATICFYHLLPGLVCVPSRASSHAADTAPAVVKVAFALVVGSAKHHAAACSLLSYPWGGEKEKERKGRSKAACVQIRRVSPEDPRAENAIIKRYRWHCIRCPRATPRHAEPTELLFSKLRTLCSCPRSPHLYMQERKKTPPFLSHRG